MPISLDDFNYTFEVPKIDKVPEDKREDALNEIAEYLLDSILDYVGSSKSPVSGGSFKKSLSPEYAKFSGKKSANLDLNGDMLNSLTFMISDESIMLGIFDEDEIPKAYNHNVGDTLPQRQFLPDEDQKFKSEILRGVGRILEDYLDMED